MLRRLTAQDFEKGLQISLQHSGKKFDPTNIEAPVFDGSRESGFGLFIISNCVDSVIYSFDSNNRNTISMIKNFKK